MEVVDANGLSRRRVELDALPDTLFDDDVRLAQMMTDIH